jgi:hypothetical protein
MTYQQFLGASCPCWQLLSLPSYGIIWRLVWSPLGKFPGPKLAALMLRYEFYHDGIKNGRYTWEIEKHAKYGSFSFFSVPYGR